MKSSYFIGELQFQTKKECEEYVRNVIHNLGLCQVQKSHEQFTFFDNLLQNHPKYETKKGSGVDYFYITKNPMNQRSYQTMIKRTDGSDIDFSWVQCSQFKIRTQAHYLSSAMRAAIRNETIRYKKNSELKCAYCGSNDKEYADYHVDHDNPSFLKLKIDFLSKNQKPLPTTYGNCEKYNITIFNTESKLLEQDWVTYHNTHCNFQILCRRCNLQKTK